MDDSILVVYESVTGFTRQYALWIGEELDCPVAALDEISAGDMSGRHTVIFGGRFHAGKVDGLKKAKRLFGKSGSERLILFACGATPDSQGDMIAEAWKQNLTEEELKRIPHFYLQGGLKYETMPFGDRLMMKFFAAAVRRKKDKSPYETAMAAAVGSSFDISSKEKIKPLVVYARETE